MARQGRGRLSTIDRLPDEADQDIIWMNDELRANKRHQFEILDEFNARIADRGIGPISKSTFNRYSVRKAVELRQHDQARRLSAEVARSLGAGGADEVTVAIAEMAKVRALQLFEAGKVDPKGLMEISRAVQAMVSAAKMSTEHRQRLEQSIKARIDKAVDAVEGEIAKGGEAKDGAAVLKRIREDIYSVFDPVVKRR